MKIIFLDIDGVLNSHSSNLYYRERHDGVSARRPFSEQEFCLNAVKELKILLETTNANIVITSARRKIRSLEQLKEAFSFYHIDESIIIDKTGNSPTNSRDEEIMVWLNSHKVSSFVIIDDSEVGETLSPYWVRTNMDSGFMTVHRYQAEEILQRTQNLTTV